MRKIDNPFQKQLYKSALVFVQKNWRGSAGAEREEKKAIATLKERIYEK